MFSIPIKIQQDALIHYGDKNTLFDKEFIKIKIFIEGIFTGYPNCFFSKIERSVQMIDLHNELQKLDQQMRAVLVRVIYDNILNFNKKQDVNLDIFLEFFTKIQEFVDIGSQVFSLFSGKYLKIQGLNFQTWFYEILNSQMFINLFGMEEFRTKFNLIKDAIEFLKNDNISNLEYMQKLRTYFQFIQNFSFIKDYRIKFQEYHQQCINQINESCIFDILKKNRILNEKVSSIFPFFFKEWFIYDFDKIFISQFQEQLLNELIKLLDDENKEDILLLVELFKEVDKIEILMNKFIFYIDGKMNQCENMEKMIQFIQKKKRIQFILKEHQEIDKSLEVQVINNLNNTNQIHPKIFAQATDIIIRNQNFNVQDMEEILYMIGVINKNQAIFKELFDSLLSRSLKFRQFSNDEILLEKLLDQFGEDIMERSIELIKVLKNQQHQSDNVMKLSLFDTKVWNLENKKDHLINFDLLPEPFQQMVQDTKKSFLEQQGEKKRKQLILIEDFNLCELELEYQDKVCGIRCDLIQALIFKTLIDHSFTVQVPEIQAKYQIEKDLILKEAHEMNKVLEVFEVDGNHIHLSKKIFQTQFVDFKEQKDITLKDLKLEEREKPKIDIKKELKNRSKEIQALIIHSVKQNEKMEIEEVFQVVKNHLRIEQFFISDLEKVIDDLIERDFLERQSDKSNILIYV